MILGYCRVSSIEQAAEGTTSLVEQERKCKAIADLQGAGPYDFLVYKDIGISGGTPLAERPEGKRLLADIKKGDALVSSKMDRLFRSASDALNTADLFRKQGIHLVLTDMGTDPVTGNGVAKMFFGMLALVAEFERERIAERMVDGKRGKKSCGGHVGGSAPFGYSIMGGGRSSRLVTVDHEQRIIQRIIELDEELDDDISRRIFCIRKVLAKEKLTTRNGKPWQTVQIERIIARNGPAAVGYAP